MKNINRISIILTKELYDLFEQAVSNSGTTKSATLRRWIQEPGKLSLVEVPPEGSTNYRFSMRLDAKTNSILQEKASSLGLNINTYIKLLILNKKRDSLSTQISGLENSLHFIQNNIDLGNFDQVQDFIDQTKITNSLVENYINAYKGFLLRMQLVNSKAISYINNSLKNALDNKHRLLIGLNYFQLGEIAEVTGDLESAENYLQTALEYLDVMNHPQYINRIYIAQTVVQIKKANFISAQAYLEKSLNLSQKLHDLASISRNYNELGTIKILQNNIEEGSIYLASSLKNSLKTNSNIQIYHNYEKLGRLYLLQDRFDLAHKTLELAQLYESNFRPANPCIRTSLFKLHIRAHSNYESSITIMKKLLNGNMEQINADISEYIYAATLYKLGNQDDRQTGLEKLRIMSDTVASELLRRIAKQTIINNRLEYVR